MTDEETDSMGRPAPALTGPRPGQWVRFYRDGRMVIAVVQYVRPASSWERAKYQVDTDQGRVTDDAILETR